MDNKQTRAREVIITRAALDRRKLQRGWAEAGFGLRAALGTGLKGPLGGVGLWAVPRGWIERLD